MKVLSVNISEPQTIEVNGKSEVTGYFKKPVESIHLGSTDVKGDCVIDREHHGGEDKACYLFGFNHYKFLKEYYPEVEYMFGMFGENITIDELDESSLRIGDVLEIGGAVIQITQPRQPCYKMGIKFQDQKIVKAFRLAQTPGIYVRVLKEGIVAKNDLLKLIKTDDKSPSVLAVYRLIYSTNPEREELLQIVGNPYLAVRLKEYIKVKFKLL